MLVHSRFLLPGAAGCSRGILSAAGRIIIRRHNPLPPEIGQKPSPRASPTAQPTDGASNSSFAHHTCLCKALPHTPQMSRLRRVRLALPARNVVHGVGRSCHSCSFRCTCSHFACRCNFADGIWRARLYVHYRRPDDRTSTRVAVGLLQPLFAEIRDNTSIARVDHA